MNSTRLDSRNLWIYATGVAIAAIGQLFCMMAWPHTSNLADPLKAQLSMAAQVIAGAAATWLYLGLIRINRSASLRRKPVTWLLLFANVLIVLLGLPSSYT